MSDEDSLDKKNKILKNPGMQEMEKIILQLYVQKVITKNDIMDLSVSLKQLASELHDKIGIH